MYIGLQIKYQLFLSDCDDIRISSVDSRNTEISNLMKILPFGVELNQAD